MIEIERSYIIPTKYNSYCDINEVRRNDRNTDSRLSLPLSNINVSLTASRWSLIHPRNFFYCGLCDEQKVEAKQTSYVPNGMISRIRAPTSRL